MKKISIIIKIEDVDNGMIYSNSACVIDDIENNKVVSEKSIGYLAEDIYENMIKDIKEYEITNKG
ncbi:MAG TPA: hypothetical protein PKI46_02850 [Bacteroidales bacterium]|nr:hypothetical protein [Bacteroidales bacterium]